MSRRPLTCAWAASGDEWAALASVGHIITNQQPDFDSRNYGHAKLSDLITATTLFELDRRTTGDGGPGSLYARDKRHRPNKWTIVLGLGVIAPGPRVRCAVGRCRGAPGRVRTVHR